MIKILYLFFPLFVTHLIFSQSDTSIIFSEIMFYPASGNNEFIELYNISTTESVDLTNWKIKYYTSANDLIIDAGFGTVLPPQTFAIIFENDYDLLNGIYSGLVPTNALVLKISDGAFGSSGMANTTGRPLWLLNSADDTVDYYFYSANNLQTYSDEKILMNRDSLQTNWANSLVSNGTPGFTNSVTPLNYDLLVSSLVFNPPQPILGEDVSAIVTIKNKGAQPANNFSIEIYNDSNFDSVGQITELVFSQSFSNLQSNDSLIVTEILSSLSVGTYQIISKVIFNEDENLLNNQLIKSFTIYPPGNVYNDLIINEIMYAPSSGQPEWVEVFNKSESPINLKNWKFADATTSVTITNSDFILQPDSFVVLTADSSILNFFPVGSPIIKISVPALNNTGDAVVIKDSINTLIDSVNYFPSWGGNTGGKSLERIIKDNPSNDPQNWKTSQSIFNATPGKINSVTPKNYDLTISKFKSAFEYGIIGESISFSSTVKNIGLNLSAPFDLLLYNDTNIDSIPQSGELVSQQGFNSLAVGDSISSEFITENFYEGENNFILLVNTSQDDDSTNNIAFTKVVGVSVNETRDDIVINEIMYAPSSPEPEWIELFNRSEKTISLKNYKLADAVDTTKVISDTLTLHPKEFLVIAKDSSVINFYNIQSRIYFASFPTLNNTDDKIILLDSLNRVIDSLQYFSGWGGINGKSLERVDVNISSTDSTNWKSSISKYKATPGTFNSVTKKDFDILISDILFQPKYPLNGDDVNIAVMIKNIGNFSSSYTLSLFEDTNLDSIPDILLETLTQLQLSSNDSAVVNFSYLIQNLINKKGIFIIADFQIDLDTSNNYLYKTIEPGFPLQTIVVNEIMFAPLGGEPEWIELYNNSGIDINLNGWKISDVITTPVSAEITTDFTIRAGNFAVLTKDTSIFNYHRFIFSPVLKLSLPTLNNDIDGVVLKDNRGLTIDSVYYSNQWGGTNGFSLERISSLVNSNQPSNWASSIDIEQSTPGRINSVTPKVFDLQSAEIIFSPRFPVAGDNVSVSAKVKNTGLNTASAFEIKFFIDTDSNNVVDRLLSVESSSNLAAGDSIIISASSQIQNLQRRTLVAASVSFAEDVDTLNNYSEKFIEPGFASEIIKINEVMYYPNDSSPEWVELVNTSSDSVNIKNWSIGDVLTTPTKALISAEDIFIHPNEYFIISRDTSFRSVYPNVQSKVFYANIGTLGNTSDGVVLYDFRNGIIDSLFYRSSWGNKKGVSLERISLSEPTNDSTNWTLSLSQNGSTPGEVNSIFNMPSYQRNTVVINEIMFDPDVDNSEYIEFYNQSSDSINIGGWTISDENWNTYKLSSTSFSLPPKSYFLLIADSIMLSKYNLYNYDYKIVVGTSSLGLVNTGELILLKDVQGNVIDSVYYSDKWQNKNIISTKNKSLERINPALGSNDQFNWNTCVNEVGGTPGFQNSIFTENKSLQSGVSVSPNPFSPDNDGFEDYTIINFNLSQAVSQIKLKIFDSRGRLVRTIYSNQPGSSKGSVIFDGLDDDGNPLRIGIYIILLESLNENSGVVETIKSTVVVARKLN
ncbi:lamin tail domain-containing protein [Ignavibacterium sp.]|uniref:lamin tail domain-containing protein n=1 Tax=Ignavibacterium sp. TaxID=2651167 RepID=UPI00307EDC26